MNICTVDNLPSEYKDAFKGITTAKGYNEKATELLVLAKTRLATFEEIVKNTYPKGYINSKLNPIVVESGFGAGLLNSAGNLFVKGFKLKTGSAKERSTLLEQTSPIDYVLGNLTTRAETMSTAQADDSKRYSSFISWFNNSKLNDVLSARLKEFLGKNKNLDNAFTVKPVERLKGGVAGMPQLFKNGRLINLTTITGSGKDRNLVYDKKLLEAAKLAAAQWMLNTSSLVRSYDPEERAAAIFKISEDYVTKQHLAYVNDGFTATEAIDSLATKIEEYWGVSQQSDARVGYSQGISKSLAAELLNSMVVAKTLQVKPFDSSLLKGENVTVNIYQPTEDTVTNAEGIVDNNLLDKLILNKQMQGVFVDSVPPVSEKVKNSNVLLTPMQKAAQAVEQAIEHKLNPSFLRVVEAMGTDGMALFNEIPAATTELMNKNHALSVEGTIRQNENVLKEMIRLNKEIEMVAEEKGIKATEVPVRYKHEIISNGRSNMQGLDNPQANKWMRHMMMPTHDNIQLNNPVHVANFLTGVAQALGIRVHEKSQQYIIDTLTEATNELQNAFAAIDTFNEGGALVYETIHQGIKAAGFDSTPMALLAMLEWRKYDLAANNKAEVISSPMYVEADGVNAGPGSAMYLLATQSTVDAPFFDLLKQVGFFFGSEKRTLNEERTVNKNDLYSTVGQVTTDALNTYWGLSKPPIVTEHINAFKYLVNALAPGLTVEGNNLIIGRKGAKNPTTIVIYGSGSMGIANNIVSEIMGLFYESLSDANENTKENGTPYKESLEEVLNDKFDIKIDVGQLLDSIYTLSKEHIVFSKDKQQFFEIEENYNGTVNELEFTKNGFANFTLNPEAVKRITENVNALYTRVLKESVNAVVGVNGADKGSKYIQQATNVQSLFLQHEFEQEYNKIITSEKRSARDGISPDELRTIEEKLYKKYPFVNMGNFSLNLTKRGKLVGDSVIGVDFSESIEVNPTMFVPKAIGVGGAPQVVISTTDAQMMLTYTAENKHTDEEHIYDGIHVKPSVLQERGEQINKAVFSSWNTNVFAPVYKSFSTFVTSVNTRKVLDTLPSATISELYRTLEGKKPDDTHQSAKIIFINNSLTTLIKNLETSSTISEARSKVLSQYAWSIDQMAATGGPYQHKGKTPPASMEEAIKQINSEIEKEINNLELTGWSATEFLATRIDKYTPEQRRAITIALSNKELKDYKIILSNDSISTDDVEINGQINIDKKIITIYNDQRETVAHELIHAATYLNVLDYYNTVREERSKHKLHAAIKNLEKLKIVFNEKYATKFEDVAKAIEGKSEAEALNEFMAWGLTNEALVKSLSKETSPVKNLIRYVNKAVLNLLKAIGFNVDTASTVYGSLIFNTAIVAGYKTTVSNVTNATLNHASVLGSADRLNDLATKFNNLVSQYLIDNPSTVTGLRQDSEAVHQQHKAILTAIQTGDMVHAQFYDMKPAELSVFRKMITAFATSAKIDASSMIKAQELYNHVVKNLKYTDFLDDPNTQDQQKLHDANQKYKVIVGELKPYTDTLGRSTLVPVFLALAQTNEEFQKVLSKIALPEKQAKDYSSTNKALTTIANTALYNLGNKLANQGNEKDVAAATTALINNIVDIANDDQTMLEKISNKGDSYLNYADKAVANGLQQLAEKTIDKSTEIGLATNSKLVRAITAVTAITAQVASEKYAGQVAEDLTSTLNKTNIWKPFKEIVFAVMGRTQSNHNIYDLVKRVRAMTEQARQHFREDLPATIGKKFSRKLTETEWSNLFKLAKTDIAGKDITNLMGDATKISLEILALEKKLNAEAPQDWALTQKKAKQLANYMNTGIVGKNLLRNAETVAMLLEEVPVKRKRSAEYVSSLNDLISLYALQTLDPDVKISLSSLVQEEKEGIEFLMAYLVGQRKEEQNRIANAPKAKLNYYKGYVPKVQGENVDMVVAEISKEKALLERGYIRVGMYKNSPIDTTPRAYYYLNAPTKAKFKQGIIQNIKQTAGGVNAATGLSIDFTGGHILRYKEVRATRAQIFKDNGTLMPLFDETGNVRGYERTIEPTKISSLNYNTNLAQMIGVWRGRQYEELESQKANEVSLERLFDMWTKEKSTKAKEYVNILDAKVLVKEPVLRDAVRQLNDQTLTLAESHFGPNTFMVRKDLLDMVVGHRSASIGDAWTGVSDWDPKVLAVAKNVATAAFGNNAYKYLTNTEQVIQNFVSDAKLIIVVKSVIVPVANILSNVIQLRIRGVPTSVITSSYPKKLNEINFYIKTLTRNVEIEAELRATTDIRKERTLKLEQQTIKDSQKRLSIWPLIEAGEFSAISDVNIDQDDVMLSEGRLHAYMEKLVNKLPGDTATIGKYALITKDTALFKGLERSVQYGDFLGKAIYYDYLTETSKLSKEDALGEISDEFVNYDISMGRTREFLDHMGLWWFSTFKIRSIKTAASMLRRNPLNTVLFSNMPGLEELGIETPATANLLMVDSSYSLGIGQALNAPFLNPWVNLTN